MKDRITVKDLKEFLKDLDEKAPVFVDSYKGQNHYKEFLRVDMYDEHGKNDPKELLVVSEEL